MHYAAISDALWHLQGFLHELLIELKADKAQASCKLRLHKQNKKQPMFSLAPH